MLRLFVLIAAAFFTTAASAQTVILRHAPVYQNGEYSTGELTSLNGDSFSIFQFAEVRGGATFINMVVRDQSGKVVTTTRTNFETLLGEERTSGAVVRTIGNSCTVATFYPLIAGKRYECVSEHETDNEKYTSKSAFVHYTVVGQAGYCAVAESDDPNLHTVVQACFSADGKWVKEMYILRYEQKRKA